VRLAANASFRYRGETRFEDAMSGVPMTGSSITVGSGLPFGAGVAYALSHQKFDVVAEVIGEVPLVGENYLPLEALAGIKVYLAKNSFLMLGGGLGLVPSQGGNPDLRAFLGIVFEPNIGDRDGDGLKDDVDLCPDDPEDFDDFSDSDGCPELDNDMDGILDEDDQCPNEPEDKDQFEDEDGCPEGNEFDRDGDGILDEDDACPDDPEDVDDFEDEDGCPDPDNDGDKILDIDDLCPNDPEDYDRFEDENGCPDPDNDHDRVLDEDDDCRGTDGQTREETAETWNDVEDDDGCPDRGRTYFDDGKLVALENIYFEYNSAKIKPISFSILDAIARTMELNPDITRIEVQGHTDERGGDDYNLKLSQARSESVVAYLVGKHIDASRLVGQGYGERMPLNKGHNQEAWAENRRVEFLILSRAGEP
jgi:outer membrane protein OmpA-like peptidoglycan-associated protein